MPDKPTDQALKTLFQAQRNNEAQQAPTFEQVCPELPIRKPRQRSKRSFRWQLAAAVVFALILGGLAIAINLIRQGPPHTLNRSISQSLPTNALLHYSHFDYGNSAGRSLHLNGMTSLSSNSLSTWQSPTRALLTFGIEHHPLNIN